MSNSLSGKVLIFLLTGWAANVAGADWPQWRGPDRDGVSRETGLLPEWPEAGPPLLWKATGIGVGYSTVSVQGARVYTLGQAEGETFVFALKEADGVELWSTTFGKGGAPGWGRFSGTRSTPALGGGLVVALSQYGELAAVDALSGEIRWQVHLVENLGGHRPEWGYSESPLIDGGRVICSPGEAGGTVAALSLETGDLLWRSQGWNDEAQYASCVGANFGGIRQYVQVSEEHVGAVAAEDGRLLWQVARRGKMAVVPTPIVRGDFVYVTSGYGAGSHLYRVDFQGGLFNVEEIYASKAMKNQHGGVVLLGDQVYGYSDGAGWVCQDFMSGRLIWNDKKLLMNGSLTGAEGRLYLRAQKGSAAVVLIEPTSSGFLEKGRFTPPDRSNEHSWAHPVIANGRLYLRDWKTLLCYDLRRPE